MKKSLLISIVVTLALAGCVSKKRESFSGGAEKDNLFYSLGYLYGKRLEKIKLTEDEMDKLLMGMADSIQGKKAAVDTKKYQGKIQKLFKKRMAKVAEAAKSAGKKYLEQYVKDGGLKTKSGIAYKIFKTLPPKPLWFAEIKNTIQEKVLWPTGENYYSYKNKRLMKHKYLPKIAKDMKSNQKIFAGKK